jgi:DNA-binding YbaB/EbfC family protein
MDFDPSNLGAMMGMFQQRMAAFKEQIAQTKCEGTAGGGLVTVTVTGDYQVESVSIQEGAMEDRELLEDLVRAATGDALTQVRTKMQDGMQQLTGGLPLPPGLMPF